VPDSYGGVVVSGGGQFLLREPAGHFGGLTWTFAKTVAQSGESPEQAALRAVSEKTGYDALVIQRLCGVFEGASGPATYFLMEARHPPKNPNWQTSAIRWARADEAAKLIGLSASAHGRQRDLKILAAANAVFVELPFAMHPIVHPVDWPELKSLPGRHARLSPRLAFNAEEMERIARGFVKHDMDAKWFIYLDGARLRLHRSWTGILIFDAGIVFDERGGGVISEVLVNRDESQYSSSSDADDLQLFIDVIRWNMLDTSAWPAN